MASDLETLLEMGFDKARAEIAIKQSGGLQGAMDWLEKTQDTPLDELQDEQEEAKLNAQPLAEGAVAMSLVCNDCGKKFRNHAAAEFHASKTEHTDFSESTEEIAPLTEEEKKARLEELRQKVKAKRAMQSEVDKEDQKNNERIRQKATRETQDLKEELARKEQIKEAAKKRQEKADDLEAKRRIKAKIEADKEERRRKAEMAKAARDGTALPAAATAAPAPAAPAAAPRAVANHSEARLRLQTSGGNVMKTLPAETTLFELAQMLQEENGITVTKFIMNFPKKIFEGHLDFGKTLKEAGLTPSAALQVQ
ncbi:UBA/TS-N domain-containing protein [Microdochium bolleyi]|uniref:UBA/TS-N domain-containing protein n=1 Tax=Microdochium bolleyi TaxID=196109 RepID=A0A136J0T6_9PEZI|nr:UBA/TS-N domain-containing protein [Microdochium bolleyi]